MNVIRFNEPLESFVRSDWCTDKKSVERMMGSPLVVWREEMQDQFNASDAPWAFFDTGCPRLPFQEMRVDGYYHFAGPGWMKYRAWIQSLSQGSAHGYQIIMLVDDSDGGRPSDYGLSRMPLAIFSFSPSMHQHHFVSLHTWIDVKTGSCSKGTLDEKILVALCNEWVNKMCMDFYNPHLYLCKKSPPIPNGHTIAWQKAREHYVLLHKTHPANRADSHGKTITTDGAEIERCAHSRRAHFRMLRSPRFTRKQGQRIWVQSAWVGPKEWTDHSGQIYRIVDRPNPVLTTPQSN